MGLLVIRRLSLWLGVVVTLAVLVPAMSRWAQSPSVGIAGPELVAEWGCDECDGAELLGEIQNVAVTASGTVFALDSHAPAIRRFAVGARSVAFGRDGEGPGEFGLASFIGVTNSAAIEIIDQTRRRVTRLSFEGNVLATSPLRPFPVAAAYAGTGAGWYIAAIDWARGGSRVVRIDVDGRLPDAVGAGDFPLDAEGQLASFFPLAARPSGGFAVGDGAVDYRIRLYGAAGTDRGEIYRAIDRLAKTEAEIDAELDRALGGAARQAEMSRAESGSRRAPAPEIDPFKRHFYGGSLRYDDADRLWVLTGRGSAERTVFDVFDANTRYLGEVVVEGNVRRYDLAGEWLATVGLSELYYPVVRLWRVRGVVR